jgi:FSR family fosmidomycin resistance protein-like MFS transporter
MAKNIKAFFTWRAAFLRGALSLAVTLLFIEFFDELNYGVEGAVFPALRLDLGLSYAQAGLLLGLPGLLSAFIEPLIMLLGDTRLRKPLVIAGGFTIALGLFALSQAQSFGLALAALILIFPASGAFVTLSQATLMDHNPGREAQMMARWTVFGSLGNLVGPLMAAGVFAFGGSWRTNYLVVAALALVFTLSAIPQRFTRRQSVDAQPGAREPQAAGLVQDLRGLLPTLDQAVRNPGLMRWFILLDLSDLLLDVFLSYSALYFADVVGLSAGRVALMMGALMAAGLVANLILIPVLERVPGRRLVRVTAAAAGLCYAAWLLAP